MDRGAWGATVYGFPKELDATATKQQQMNQKKNFLINKKILKKKVQSI